MPGIDETLTFYPLRIAVLTVSDSRTDETDKSGALLAERLAAAGHELAGKAIVRDDVEAIRAQVRAWAEDEGVDVIISTGGTGFAPRDVTPEAVKPLFRREMDGFSILFHHASYGTVGFSTLQSRAFAG
ncbi:MAG: molybdopterin adenylyltransferase, partial [Sphingomonadales bacterium]|nr:molybdopterin adenylyltransferase [Sphingomonadales bacterium]